MIDILQWTTLAVCGLVALARIPSALRGENRSLFSIFALMTLAILLSIEAPYVWIDAALGGINLTNLALRFIIFGAVFFIGVRTTRGFGADGAYRLLTGRVGMAALLVISVAVVGVFLLMDTTGSSAGLSAVSDRDARHAMLAEYYGAAGRAYPAFVALVLLPAMVRAALGRLPVPVRFAAVLLGLGAIATALSLLFPFLPPNSDAVAFVVNYTAILCFVLGLALIWAAKVWTRRKSCRRRKYTEK